MAGACTCGVHVAGRSGGATVSWREAGQTRTEREWARRDVIPPGRRARYDQTRRRHRRAFRASVAPLLVVSRVLGLGELALRCRIPLDGLRATEFTRRLALTARQRALLREAIRLSFGELMDYRHFYVAGAPLSLNGPLAALDRPLALAG